MASSTAVRSAPASWADTRSRPDDPFPEGWIPEGGDPGNIDNRDFVVGLLFLGVPLAEQRLIVHNNGRRNVGNGEIVSGNTSLVCRADARSKKTDIHALLGSQPARTSAAGESVRGSPLRLGSHDDRRTEDQLETRSTEK